MDERCPICCALRIYTLNECTRIIPCTASYVNITHIFANQVRHLSYLLNVCSTAGNRHTHESAMSQYIWIVILYYIRVYLQCKWSIGSVRARIKMVIYVFVKPLINEYIILEA